MSYNDNEGHIMSSPDARSCRRGIAEFVYANPNQFDPDQRISYDQMRIYHPGLTSKVWTERTIRQWGTVTEPFEPMPASSSTPSSITPGAPDRSNEAEVLRVNNTSRPLFRLLNDARTSLEVAEQEIQRGIKDFDWVDEQLDEARTDNENMRERMVQAIDRDVASQREMESLRRKLHVANAKIQSFAVPAQETQARIDRLTKDIKTVLDRSNQGWNEAERLQAALQIAQAEARHFRAIVNYTIPKLERERDALRMNCGQITGNANTLANQLRRSKASEQQARSEVYRMQQNEASPTPDSMASPPPPAGSSCDRCAKKLAEFKPANKPARAHASGKGLAGLKSMPKSVHTHATGEDLFDRKPIRKSTAVAAAATAMGKKPQGIQKKQRDRIGGKGGPVAANEKKSVYRGLEELFAHSESEEEE